MICLDTNAVIAAISGRTPYVRQRLEMALTNGLTVGIPSIVLYEMWYGIWKSARIKSNIAALKSFLSLEVTPWGFEPEDAREAGEVRALLEQSGMPIGPYDILIAGQARRRGAVLVTANRREFIRVPGLTMEDWSEPIS